MTTFRNLFLTAILLFVFVTGGNAQLNTSKAIAYCAAQADKTLKLTPNDSINIPRNIPHGKKDWRFVGYKDWCSGFWPGILWYVYEGTHNKEFKARADQFSAEL